MTAAWNKPRPWKAATAWTFVLGPFFFLVYGLTNWYTSLRGDVSSLYYEWERSLPFVPQLMLPYMSIDLLFVVALFLCRTRWELDRHAYRVMTAIAISAIAFLLFPLQFAFERPPVEGFNGFLLTLLTSFDKPYNQAPSLHISLLLVLWVLFARHLNGLWQLVMHLWFFLIGISVVLVYQHHVTDVHTGFAVGIVVLYLFPDDEWKVSAFRLTGDPFRRKIGALYAGAAALCLGITLYWQGWSWLLLWPATSLFIVSSAYLFLGADVFQKRNGRLSFAARWVLAPYLIGAWSSYRLFSRGCPASVALSEDIFIGRLPRSGETDQAPWHSVVDLTAEFSSPVNGERYHNLPLLDLAVPDANSLRQAAKLIEQARLTGPVLVHCALGASRSVAAVIAWMVQHGHASDIAHAESIIARHWRTVLTPAHRAVLAEAVS